MAEGYYDPSKYKKDFSWIGNIGSTIAEHAPKMQELVRFNKAVKENQSFNQDTYDKLNQWVDTIMASEKLKQQMSANYGLEDPEELRAVLINKFRKPKGREANEVYAKDVTFAMRDVLEANKDVDPALLGMMMGGSLPGATSKDVMASYDRSKSNESYKDFVKWYDEGVADEEDPTGKRKRKPTIAETDQRNRETYDGKLKWDEPDMKHRRNQSTQQDDAKQFQQAINQIDATETSFSEMYVELSEVNPNISEGMARAIYRDKQIDDWKRRDSTMRLRNKDEIIRKNIEDEEGDIDKAITRTQRMIMGVRDDLRGLEGKKKSEMDKKEQDRLLILNKMEKVYKETEMELLSGDVSSYQEALKKGYSKTLEDLKDKMMKDWEGNKYGGGYIPFKTWGKGDDKKRLEHEAEVLGLKVQWKTDESGTEYPEVAIDQDLLKNLTGDPYRGQKPGAESEIITNAYKAKAQAQAALKALESGTQMPVTREQLMQIIAKADSLIAQGGQGSAD